MQCLVVLDIHDGPGPRACAAFALSQGAPRPWQVTRLRLGALLPPGPTGPLTGPALHQRLTAGGGFEEATERLLALGATYDVAIGYSAGGTLLWRAALRGLGVGALFCVSSTRLRLERQRPPCPVRTLFAADDPNRPDRAWADALGVPYTLLAEAGHDFYADPDLPAWRASLRELEAMVRGLPPPPAP